MLAVVEGGILSILELSLWVNTFLVMRHFVDGLRLIYLCLFQCGKNGPECQIKPFCSAIFGLFPDVPSSLHSFVFLRFRSSSFHFLLP